MNIHIRGTQDLIKTNEINQIKSAKSLNNNFFICLTDLYEEGVYIPSCYINNFLTNEFKKIECDIYENYNPNYKVLYFEETNDFMHISRLSLRTTLFNDDKNFMELCGKHSFSYQYNVNSIIYNNGYKLVNYSNFSNYMKCNNISISQKETIKIGSSYIKEYTNLINSEKLEDLTLYIKEYTNKTRYEIFRDINEVLENKKIGVNYEIEGKDFNIIIKPTNSTFFDDKTRVDFDKCEQLLREEYNISNSSILSFFQMEINNEDNKALYNQIKYLTFDENKKILDLSLCDDINTNIYYTIKNDSNLNIASISDFKQLGIDILNLKDQFFNDLCYSYSDSNNDMILEDRIKYLYQNYSLCEEGCSYNNIDIDNMNIVCNCKIQGDNESYVNITPLVFEDAKDVSFFDSNIGVAKCYKLVFSMNNKFKNIGFIFFSILVVLYIICIIFYFIKGINPIIEYLYNEMVKKGYLKSNDPKFFEEKTEKKNKGSKKTGKSNPNKINKIKRSKKKSKSIRINNHTEAKEENPGSLNKESTSKLSRKKTLNLIKSSKKSEKEENINNFGIIKINLKEEIKNYIPENSNQSLYNYTYEEAIKYDRRNIFRVAYIYLLNKQIIFRNLFQRSPLELYPIRFILFIFMFSCDLALNALFYFNDNISKKYRYAKNLFLLAFSSNITIIIYSTLVSYALINLLNKLSHSSNAIRNVFREEEDKIKKDKKYKYNDSFKKKIYSEIENILKKLKIKIACLLFIQTILILFFWYFVTAFCHVYSSTQTSWLLDSFLSILSRLIIELIFSFLYGKLYQVSVASNFETLYKIVMFLYDFS